MLLPQHYNWSHLQEELLITHLSKWCLLLTGRFTICFDSAFRRASRHTAWITMVYRNQKKQISAVLLNIVQFAITNSECTKLWHDIKISLRLLQKNRVLKRIWFPPVKYLHILQQRNGGCIKFRIVLSFVVLGQAMHCWGYANQIWQAVRSKTY